MSGQKLSRAQHELLGILVFREAAPGGPSWIVQFASNRLALYVVSMVTAHGYAYLKTINIATLRALYTAGLIEYGAEGPMPDWHRPRFPQEPSVGCTVAITDAGREALAGRR